MYTRNKSYSETAEENLQEAKIACDAESPWTYSIDIKSEVKVLYNTIHHIIHRHNITINYDKT